MPSRVFISYRWDDLRFLAQMTQAELRRRGFEAILDDNKLLAGEQFKEELARHVQQSDVLLLLVGPKWHDLLRDKRDQYDYIGLELEVAHANGVVIVPVSLEGAATKNIELPEAARHVEEIILNTKAAKLRQDDFERDFDEIEAVIKRSLPWHRRKRRWSLLMWLSATPFLVALVAAAWWRVQSLGVGVPGAGALSDAEAPASESGPTTEPKSHEIEVHSAGAQTRGLPRRRRAHKRRVSAQVAVLQTGVEGLDVHRWRERLLNQGIVERVWIVDRGGPDVFESSVARTTQKELAGPVYMLIGGLDSRFSEGMGGAPYDFVQVGPDGLDPDVVFRGFDLMGAYSLKDMLTVQAEAEYGRYFRSSLGGVVILVGPQSCRKRAKTIKGLKYHRICAGFFVMGSEAYDDAKPPHVSFVRSFWMQKYEFSLGEAGAENRQSVARLPLTRTTWSEAAEHCRRVDARLPSEVEWEYAARGWESRMFPHGNGRPGPRMANFAADGPEGVDARPQSSGPFGIEQQAGNVFEWVADCYDARAYVHRVDHEDRSFVDRTSPATCDDGDGAQHVFRGGGFRSGAEELNAAKRDPYEGYLRSDDVGFRCVWPR